MMLPAVPIQLQSATGESSTSSSAADADVIDQSMQSSGAPLSQRAQLQQSFGPFDLGAVRVHQGGAAKEASEALFAKAFTRGEHIVSSGSMNLRTEAHEAAHVIQQRQPGLVNPGLSQPFDAAERHADAVADRVVQGKSAVDLLQQMAPSGMQARDTTGHASMALQRWPNDKTPAQRVDAAKATVEKFVRESEDGTLRTVGLEALQKLNNWKTGNRDELARLGAAMHLGSGGTETARALRRAIILLRVAVLRNEMNKVKREVQALDANELDGALTQAITDSSNYEKPVTQKFHEEALGNSASRAKTDLNSFYSLAQRNDRDKSSTSYLQEEQALLDAHAHATQEKEAFSAQRAQRPRITFVPSREPDSAMQANIDHLGLRTLYRGAMFGLEGLRNGGELYVVGHGNWGTAVGAHGDAVNETDLLAALLQAKLPQRPQQQVELYIWACWGAVDTSRLRGYAEPYAQRLAALLASRGYENYHVIGFAGSVNEGGLYQSVDLANGREVDSNEVTPSQYHSIYAVGSGDHNRIRGEDWQGNATVSGGTRRFRVRRPGAR